MKLSPEKQKHLAITLAVVVGLNFAAYWFGIRGLDGKQTSDNNKAMALEALIKKSTGEIATEKDNREKAKIFKDYIASIEDQLPKGNVETWLLKELEQITKLQKVEASSPTFPAPPDPGIVDLSNFRFKDQPYKLVSMRFGFTGELNEIGRFLEYIENNKPLMEVNDISITPGSSQGPHMHNVIMQLSMVTAKQG